MSAALKIYGRKTSSNVQAVMWCVGELGLAHERFDLGHKFGGTDTEAFLKLNPNGLIPVVQDGQGAAIFETGAILRYLAAAYGDDTFWPKDPARRAEVDKWAEWAKLNVAMAITGSLFWPLVRVKAHPGKLAQITQGLKILEGFLAIAEARLSTQPFLAGGTSPWPTFNSVIVCFAISICRSRGSSCPACVVIMTPWPSVQPIARM